MRLANRGGVTADAQGVAVNVDVFDVDGGGESFERVVVESMQRSHQPQVFRDALRHGLGQRVILYREGDVGAEQFERVEFAVFIERVARAATECDNSGEPASGL